jgi:protein-S-isoprenylcysteine O-methyltransferase
LFPGLKSSRWLFVVALGMVIAFQALRTIAMYTAASNFTHQIAEHKTESHELVTTGVYAYLRHPSYCGWFWWAIGTQLLLANPICVVGYAAAAWRFFDDRIRYEEETLREYFGENYVRYAAKTGAGIPFIR